MTKGNRRQFLEQSLVAATAAAILPAQLALGADKKKQEKPKKKSPGERLSVAIVGVGGRGSEHIRQFLALPETEITYIVDPDEKIGQMRVAAIAKKQERKPKRSEERSCRERV